ncbi:MAG: TIGR00266 family protein [Deltaproteobacteria bacterium]|nr:TIGR00266 family protein [Deltaproteobacteria bacterium]
MKVDVESRPSYGLAVVTLNKGETFISESGAMVAMSSGLKVDTKFNGTGDGSFMGKMRAMLVGLARKFLAGESLFINQFDATTDGQQVMLAPTLVGDVEKIKMTGGRKITVQATSYLASGKNIEVGLIWGGFSMLFGGEGAFFLECTGKGPLLINSYGAIEKVEITGGYIVDTGHVVGWEGDLTYKIKKAGGWKSTLLSGEGLVLEFTGTGTLWLQTRNLGSLLGWITPQLPG